MDGKPMAKFGTLEQAVEACDFELSRRGRRTEASARDDASWRRQPSGQAGARTAAESLRRSAWERIHGAAHQPRGTRP